MHHNAVCGGGRGARLQTRGLLVQTHWRSSVTEAVRHRLRRDRVSTPYYVGKTSKQSLGPRTVLGSKEWETMTLQQLCFPPSGLGELVDAVGAIQRTPY